MLSDQLKLAHDKLIVALDVPTVRLAENVLKRLDDSIKFYKIGHQLAYNGGLDLAQDLVKAGKKIFLDLKLLDIENTIAHAVENILKLDVDMLTIHAYPGAMKAAAEVVKGSKLCLLAVTVLTSMDDSDLGLAGYSISVADLVLKRCHLAKNLGMNGVVASAWETDLIRPLLGPGFVLVTPGIRPKSFKNGDQKRIAAPGEAIKAGSDYLVVGRPIIQANDPAKVALDILEEIGQAM
ncbi:orotidine-5'-phosphate decarboxylase [Bartonella sp. TP]|uniref:orotidine-5'-phosphate decarboxylase n=1 Tax=Bartonella sp. TP TaxID=3057550 RepID=UPI0025AFC96A|nr:orotidine-5'-phosphate decarboxylase [Bartonella sp. TP]MDN5249114.1 orotidine-5'-phosphate decarboxylase [Alphaproteobacteria bacterium]WJW79679.1 orotidine-5'-phosphate decarboxylase [Bartonella sp. TP]